MKKRIEVKLVLLLMAIVSLFLPVTVYAKTTLKTLADRTSEKNIQFKADMNGDGKADSFSVNISPVQGYKHLVKVKMNGKQVLSTKQDFSYTYTVQYIALSQKAQFLYIHGRGDSNMPGIHSIYRYVPSKQKFASVLNFANYLGTAGLVTKVTSKSIYVSNGCGMPSSGRVKWTFVFDYNSGKGKFGIHSSTATVKYSQLMQLNDGYDSYFAKSRYIVKKAFSAYTGVKMQKMAFKTSPGEVLQLKKIRLYNKGLYLQFTNSAGKTGWIHGYQKYGTGDQSNVSGMVFEGVGSRLAGGFFG